MNNVPLRNLIILKERAKGGGMSLKLSVSPVAGDELLLNGNMEAGFTDGLADGWVGWGATFTDETGIKHSGGHSQKIAVADNFSGIVQNVEADVNAWYINSGWVKVNSGAIQLLLTMGNPYSVDADWALLSSTGFGATNRPFWQWWGGFEGYIDDASAKLLSLPSLLSSIPFAKDFVIDVALIGPAFRQFGLVWNLDSPTAPANFAMAYYDGFSAVNIDKYVAGVRASVATPAATYVAGARLRVIKYLNTYWVIYNNVLLSTGTISDAGVVDNLNLGIFGTDANSVYSYFHRLLCPNAPHNILAIGDSKTGGYGDDVGHEGYPIRMSATASAFVEYPTRIASGGITVALMQDEIDVDLAAATGTPEFVLINLGTNDAGSLPIEATWKADYAYILDAIHTKWATAKVYCMRVWNKNHEADCDTMATWLAAIIAPRSAWCYVGPDERVFLKGSDNGVSLTIPADGVHPNPAGYQVTADQWRLSMGY